MQSLRNLFPKQTTEAEEIQSPTESSIIPQSVAWHNFTIKELLQFSKQNSWRDVQNELSSLIITLATYNPPKSSQTPIIKNITDLSIINNNINQPTENVICMEIEKQEKDCKTNEESNIKLSTFRELFHCDICLDIFIEPLTLSCGHTFCRICIIQIQSKCEKKCPLCKAVCHINAFLHSPNIIIANCSQKLCSSEEYNQRMLELEQEKKQLSATIAAFILNVIRFPGQMLQLHLFEMRYLHMINRAICSGKRFAYICRPMNYPSSTNNSGYQPFCKDIGLLVYVKECQFLPNGRCFMVGVCEKRILVSSAWVESGTQGLWMIKYEEYLDDERSDHIEKHWVIYLKAFVEYIYSLGNSIPIERECGERLSLMDSFSNVSKWSFFVCALIVYHFGERNVSLSFIRNSLKSCNVVERIQSCYDILKVKGYISKLKCYNEDDSNQENAEFDVD